MAGNYEPQRHWTVTPRETRRERTDAHKKIKQSDERERNVNKLTLKRKCSNLNQIATDSRVHSTPSAAAATFSQKQMSLCAIANYYNTNVSALYCVLFKFCSIMACFLLPLWLWRVSVLPPARNICHTHTHAHKKFSNISSSVTVSYLKFSRQIICLSDIFPSEGYFSEDPFSKGQLLIFPGNNFVKWHTDTENPAKIQPVDANRIIMITPLFSCS